MGILNLILCIIAVCVSYYNNLLTAVIIFFCLMLLNLWSFLIMVKFRNSPKSIPKLWILINLITTLFAFVSLIIAIINSFIWHTIFNTHGEFAG